MWAKDLVVKDDCCISVETGDRNDAVDDRINNAEDPFCEVCNNFVSWIPLGCTFCTN